MLAVKYVWTSTGSSGALTAVEFTDPGVYSVLLCQSSTLASTQSFAYQLAQDSTGPWFKEASTSIAATATVAAQGALRITGPYSWFRPYLNSDSTGTYQFTLLGVS